MLTDEQKQETEYIAVACPNCGDPAVLIPADELDGLHSGVTVECPRCGGDIVFNVLSLGYNQEPIALSQEVTVLDKAIDRLECIDRLAAELKQCTKERDQARQEMDAAINTAMEARALALAAARALGLPDERVEELPVVCDRLRQPLPCGHPPDCARQADGLGGPGTVCCGWCAAEAVSERLRENLDRKQALVEELRSEADRWRAQYLEAIE